MKKDRVACVTSLALAFICFILMLAAAFSPWYVITDFKSTSPGFNCQFRIQRSFFSGKTTCECPYTAAFGDWCQDEYSDWRGCENCAVATCACSNETAVWNGTFMFLVVAIFFNVVVMIQLVMQLAENLAFKMTKVQILVLNGTAPTWVAILITAPLVFLYINAARENDYGNLCRNDLSIGGCHGFYGSKTGNIATDSFQYKAEWYPAVGWYFALGAAAIAVLSYGCVVAFSIIRWQRKPYYDEL